MNKFLSSDIVNLLKDVIIGMVVFFLIFIIIIYSSIFFNFLIKEFNLQENTYVYYVYSGIKYFLMSLEALALVSYFISQTIKFFKELKFLCKDLKDEY